MLLAEIAAGHPGGILFVARDDTKLARMAEALAFFAPDLERLELPAWDCLPYDRVSPHPLIVSRRIETLSRLLTGPPGRGRVVLTTASAALQRLAPAASLRDSLFPLARGGRVEPTTLVTFLQRYGYQRTGTVREPGEFAQRGGIVDVFPPGCEEPLRLDFFGDEVESLRAFDAVTQRSTDPVDRAVLKPVSEVTLDDDAIVRFRSGYRALFGAVDQDDPLYEAVSAGQRHIGMEHWLPLFHDHMDTVFDYLPDAAVILDHQLDAAVEARLDLITEYYAARLAAPAALMAADSAPYRPLPPERLFLDAGEWQRCLAGRPTAVFSPFAAAQHAPTEAAATTDATPVDLVDAGGRLGLDFAEARQRGDVNVFDALAARVREHRQAGKRTVIAATSTGARDRLGSILTEHGVRAAAVETWPAVIAGIPEVTSVVVLPLEHGFVARDLAVIAEQDILGDRLVRRTGKRLKPENFIAEASALSTGDLVVHAEHGIGCYEGLETISVAGAPHDCLRIRYAGNDRLFLPVENIDVIGRYGSETAGVQLDRLGSAQWQARKARMKARIREMADQLIQVAATRTLRQAPVMVPPEGAYAEFCARFPFAETDDQIRAIDDTLADLGGGRPTDRLICGDVGFGKTEVALRAAFVAALEGRQVAVVVPTTLLSRQHHQTFQARFTGYPVRIGQLSRLVTAKEARQVKTGLADGSVDIVIGTHALLSRSIRFRDLGLLIVDEEQHFGVAHKEALKRLREDVHVLTLTATPIPRTLQMALSGVREMSLIATPPVDRLAVRTFVLPFDPVVVREAILRERYRGGQTFYVCPRIEDLDDVAKALAQLVPEVKVITAHGRLAPKDLEAAVSAFYDGRYDILLSTNIVESGLDLPSVNTIVIHRADMFGLAQLYQLRGRVGRSKTRAYAYLTLPPRRKVTPAAQKRLDVMQTLDALGAGFTLASHDLDIRGAGNLLGEEQSGHIREVGIELYQQMLEEAVAEARGGDDGTPKEEGWSPQLAIGLSVLIPESYVTDLGVRLGLYRRLGDLTTSQELEGFAAELIDRFGPLPDEVENLLQIVAIKQRCRRAGIDKVDAGPKGAVVSFRGDSFANPAGLVRFIAANAASTKLRPDHKLVYRRSWETPGDRVAGVRYLVKQLETIAHGAAEPAAAEPDRGKRTVRKAATAGRP
ncbi:MAG: transcription-repair coupling factor [Rhodospirillales bacterium]|nr:MAG: transcription-repair coupling factor [Rhodospirillales bacterium]